MWVSALLLIVMLVDTVITAFLLGKYKQVLREVKEARDVNATPCESKKVSAPKLDFSDDELLSAARTLIGTRDER